VRPEEVGQLKKFIYLIGSRTRDLPACSIVPEPGTACPLTTEAIICFRNTSGHLPNYGVLTRKIVLIVDIALRTSNATRFYKQFLFWLVSSREIPSAISRTISKLRSGRRYVRQHSSWNSLLKDISSRILDSHGTARLSKVMYSDRKIYRVCAPLCSETLKFMPPCDSSSFRKSH
jgi:hypothetical protein